MDEGSSTIVVGLIDMVLRSSVQKNIGDFVVVGDRTLHERSEAVIIALEDGRRKRGERKKER